MECVSQRLARPEIHFHQTIALQLGLVGEKDFEQLAELTNLAEEKGIQESKNHIEGCGGWKFCVEKFGEMVWDGDFVLARELTCLLLGNSSWRRQERFG